MERGIAVTDSNYVEVRGIAGMGMVGWNVSHVQVRSVAVEWVSKSTLERRSSGISQVRGQCRVHVGLRGGTVHSRTLLQF